jgi:cell wall-associated NlpC family hydrolase
MSFDAGSIIARLDLDDAEFDRKLRADVARIEEFDRRRGEVKLVSDVDPNELSKARRAISDLDNQVTQDAIQKARSGRGSVLGTLAAMFSGSGGGGAALAGKLVNRNLGQTLTTALSTAGDPNQSAGAKTLSSIAPGIGALGLKAALGIGGGGLLLGSLPALLAPLAAGGIGAAGLGVAALGARSLIGTQQSPGQLYAPAQAALGQLTALMKSSAQPLVAPLMAVFRQLPALITQVGPALKDMFAGAATLILPVVHALASLATEILPLLGTAFRAAAPLMAPLISGIGLLVRNFLPGVITILHAAMPAILTFSSILGHLGSDLGQVFALAAPALVQSGVLLKAVLDLIGGLLPVIVRLADVFAVALAPVVGAFAAAFRALEPSLIIVGRILGSLADAILGDLASALGALATLLAGISPSLNIFARVLTQVFNSLESAGVFGALSSALEALAPQLAVLINLIVRQMAPVLPLLVNLLSQVVTIMIQLATDGLGLVIQGLVTVLRLVPPLIPILTVLGTAWLAVQLATSLSTAATRAWTIAQGIAQFASKALAATVAVTSAVMDAGLLPVIAITAGIIALGVAAYELYTHWNTVWTWIKHIAEDAWNFIWDGFGKFLLPLLGPVGLIALGAIELAQHWQQVWQDMSNWAQDAWHYIYNDICAPMIRVFTQDIPNAFDIAVSKIGQWWIDLEGVVRAPVHFVISDVLDGLITVFDDITNAIGLGKPIPQVHPFGLAGGGRIGAGSGPTADDVLARVSRGETVVSARDSAMLAPLFEAMGIPGYATGGVPHSQQRGTTKTGSGLVGKVADIGKMTAALFSDNPVAFANAFNDMMGAHGSGGMGGVLGQAMAGMPAKLVKGIWDYLFKVASPLGASGSAIVKYAESFVGKVPYIWGGDTPAGWDCSGFVKWVYDHFGFGPPRTSEEQFDWVQRGSGPVPGGLAFFAGADGTQADPGHVGIVVNRGTMVDAYGTGFGTRFNSITGSSGAISGYGVPRGGVGIPAALGAGADAVQWIRSAMGDVFGTSSWLGGMERLLGHENAPGDPTAIDPILVDGQHAEGLFQMLPSTYAAYATLPGGIFNPVSNAVASMRYIMATYGSPYNIPGNMSGDYKGYDAGGWLMPGATVAINNTGMPEAVLSPADSRSLLSRGMSGGRLASVINIMLPEGTSVAAALSELTFRMRVSDQQALTGAGLRPGG